MKPYLKILLAIIGVLLMAYLSFVVYVKSQNPNPLWMDYRYNHAITKPLAKMGIVDAQYKMGLHYLYGWGIVPPETDLKEAVYWFEKAVENGHEKSKEELEVAKNPEQYPNNFGCS